MGTLEHPRAEGLLHNPAFSQVVAASGSRTIYTAGQVSIDERGALVGGVTDNARQSLDIS
jgi:enamine deaminase RidA (YjgF/YER057c/UK114 family)